MPRRRVPVSVPQVKTAVRARDGFACTKCGRSNVEHKATTGRQLEVHRVQPGTPYTVEQCVTLCHSCHTSEPKSPIGSADMACGEPTVRFRLSPELHSRVEATAARLGLSFSSLLRLMIREHLPEYEDRAEAIRRRENKEGE